MDFAVIFISILLISFGSAFDESCRSENAEFVKGSRFDSTKKDGRQYRCKCYGTDCIRITCTRSRGPTPSPPPTAPPPVEYDPNDISEEIPIDQGPAIFHPSVPGPVVIQPSVPGPVVIQPSVSLPPISSPVSSGTSQTCYDLLSHANYNRGEFFVRNTRRSLMYCVCPLTGPLEISCQSTPRRCIPPGTPVRVATSRYYDGCFDSWNNQEYRSGEVYERVKDMSANGRTQGRYRCTCNNGMMRCSAVDIPCCNIATGEFVDLNQRFIVQYRQRTLNCICKRGRGRFETCYEAGGSTTSPTAGPNYHPIGRDSQCQDRYTRQRYSVGSQWIQNRGYADYKCVCSRERNNSGRIVIRATCRYVAPIQHRQS